MKGALRATASKRAKPDSIVAKFEAARGSKEIVARRSASPGSKIIVESGGTWAFCALLALIPAVSGTARGLFIPGLRTSDVLVIVCVVAIAFRWGASVVPFDRVGGSLLLYGLIYSLTTLLNFIERPELPSHALLKEMLGAPQYVLLYCATFAVSHKVDIVQTWARLSTTIAASVGVLAVLQSADIGATRKFLSFITGNPDIASPIPWMAPRSTGPFYSWHALGIYLAINGLICMAVILGFPRTRTAMFGMLVRLSLILLGLATGLTFTPLVILVIGFCLIVGVKRALLLLPVIIVAGFTLLLTTKLGEQFGSRVDAQERVASGASPLLPQTIGYRVNAWVNDYLPLIGENLWDGYGPLGERDRIFQFSESMYINLLTIGGIPLLLTFLLFMIRSVKSMNYVRKLEDIHPQVRTLGLAMAVVMESLLFAQFIHPYMADAGGAAMVIVALGVINGRVRAVAADCP